MNLNHIDKYTEICLVKPAFNRIKKNFLKIYRNFQYRCDSVYLSGTIFSHDIELDIYIERVWVDVFFQQSKFILEINVLCFLFR